MYVSSLSPFILSAISLCCMFWVLVVSVKAVTFCRTRYHTCVHLALLCICDTCALDAMDRDALTAWYGLLFMVIVAFCLYDTRCVDR
jgi:hypothetical protein